MIDGTTSAQAALRQMESELEAGALPTLDPSGTRLRLLPLPRRQ